MGIDAFYVIDQSEAVVDGHFAIVSCDKQRKDLFVIEQAFALNRPLFESGFAHGVGLLRLITADISALVAMAVAVPISVFRQVKH